MYVWGKSSFPIPTPVVSTFYADAHNATWSSSPCVVVNIIIIMFFTVDKPSFSPSISFFSCAICLSLCLCHFLWKKLLHTKSFSTTTRLVTLWSYGHIPKLIHKTTCLWVNFKIYKNIHTFLHPTFLNEKVIGIAGNKHKYV